MQDKPQRLDAFLAAALPQATRSKVQAAIEAGNVLVGGAAHLKPSLQVGAWQQTLVCLRQSCYECRGGSIDQHL